MSEEETKKEVLKTIDLYIEWAKNPASGASKKAFAEWATLSHNENGKLVTNPIQTFYSIMESIGPGEVTYTLKNVTVSQTVATVSIESCFSKTGKFIDMFTLVKDECGWKIVSKVYEVSKNN